LAFPDSALSPAVMNVCRHAVLLWRRQDGVWCSGSWTRSVVTRGKIPSCSWIPASVHERFTDSWTWSVVNGR